MSWRPQYQVMLNPSQKRMLSFVQNPQVVKTALIGAGAGIIAASSISLLTGSSLALTGALAWSIVGSIVAVAARSICYLSFSNRPEIKNNRSKKLFEVNSAKAEQVLKRLSQEIFNRRVDAWKESSLKNNPLNKEYIEDATTSIKRCFEEKQTSLNLSLFNLKTLPVELGELTYLQKLYLSCSQLSVIPSEIKNLTNLQELNLSSNQIKELPPQIGRLRNLENLMLFDNQLCVLPAEIAELKNLTKLNLSNNQLSVIPSEIGGLTNLKQLFLSYNQIRELPEEVGLLRNLTSLYLSSTQLSVFPAGINNLTNLIVFNISYNQLRELPLETFSLPATCTVCIEYNRLTEATIRRLHNTANAEGYSGPRFRYNMASDNLDFDHGIGPTLEKIEALTGIELDIDDLQAAIPDESQRPFRIWINKLFWTADGKSGSDRAKAYFTVVANILNKANENESFRDDVFMPCMFEGYESCGDRIALSIIHMGLRKQILDTNPKDAKKMCDLLVRGEYALELLEEIATDKIKTLAAVDEVEVHLGFLCRLKDALDLPINLENMLYFACSCINKEDLENAKTKVEEKLKLEKAIPDFLAKNATWHNTLIALKAEEMKEIENEAESAYEVDPGMSADPEMIEKKRGDGIAELTCELLK